MTASPLALRACDIHKSFGSGARRAPILQGISLEVPRGETVFLVGPSGCGETTLLSILGCVLTADRGRVEVVGKEVSLMDAALLTGLQRTYVGFIVQSSNLFPTLSALDNIRLVLTMR